MKTSKLGIHEMSYQEMIKQSGGQHSHFNPSIDGSMLANDRVTRLTAAMSNTSDKSKKTSFWDWLFG